MFLNRERLANPT
jgi:transposase, IS6 family